MKKNKQKRNNIKMQLHSDNHCGDDIKEISNVDSTILVGDIIKKEYCEKCDCPITTLNEEKECDKCHTLICEQCGTKGHESIFCFECNEGVEE